MFTGLVEAIGRVCRIEEKGSNRLLLINAPFAGELQPGESVAVNGCCLTVVGIERLSFKVEAVAETLKRTNISELRPGTLVNLERALKLGARLGGHFVLGHIDEVGRIKEIARRQGEIRMVIKTARESTRFLIPRGSVAVDGVSLTVTGVENGAFWVNLIPWTLEKTTLGQRRVGERVNLEYDILVKAARRAEGPDPAVSFGAE